MRKTAPINIMVSIETKKRLKDKAEALNLTLTKYIEKIGNEEIIFLDENIKSFTKLFKLKEK